MDIGIDIECLRCGLGFTHSFGSMLHGRPVKCPFCSSTALEIKGELAMEGRSKNEFRTRAARFKFARAEEKSGE